MLMIRMGNPQERGNTMSLKQAMSSGKVRKRVRIQEIRVNPVNWYHPYNVEELANLIERDGQLENAIVYEDIQEDGKQYTLLGGHRRFAAISFLFEQNRGDGYMDVVIVEKPQTTYDEAFLILSDNAYRVKLPEEIKKEVQYAIDKWDYLSSIDQKPVLKEGEKKRDWIGQQVGLKGRQVQEYLTGKYADNSSQQQETDTKKEKKEVEQEDIKKNVKKAKKAIEKAIKIAEELQAPDIRYELEELEKPIKHWLIKGQEQ